MNGTTLTRGSENISLLTDDDWNHEWTIPFGDWKFAFSGPLPQRVIETVLSICHLGDLEKDWDSYGGDPINPYCALAAIQFVLEYLEGFPPPHVVPTAKGGVQFEWSESGWELEIEFCSPRQLKVFFESAEGEIETTIDSDFTEIAKILERARLTN